MSTPIPMPLRAAAGLAAVAIDEARHLPDRLVSLPVLVVGTAMQASLKVQQRYAELVARGDHLLDQLRRRPDGAPPWARFDDEEPAPGAPAGETISGAAGAAAAGAAGVPVVAEDGWPDDELPEPAASTVPVEPAEYGAPSDAVLPGEPAEVEIGDGLVDANAVSDAGLADLPQTAPSGTDEQRLAEEEIAALAAEAASYDGYLATEPPLAGYDTMSIPQLRARLRRLSARELEELISYERATAERAPYLTMLENRLATVRGR